MTVVRSLWSVVSRSVFGLALCAMLFALSHSVSAQQPKKVSRIGYLSGQDPDRDGAFEAFRLALRELGYIDGQNITFEYRHTEGMIDRRPELAAELVRLKVDVIVVSGGITGIRAARNATKRIPIVMLGLAADPVEAGLVESLARPGGNITGLTTLSRELAGKRLELLKETVPKLARVAVLYDPAVRPAVVEVKDALPVAARSLGVDSSVLGGARFGQFREGFCCAEQAASEWTLRDLGTANESQSETDCRLGVKESVAIDVPVQRRSRCRRAHVLRGGPRGQLPAHRILRGQDPEGRKACRSSRGAANKVRAGDQSQDCEADWRDDPAEDAGESGQSNTVRSEW